MYRNQRFEDALMIILANQGYLEISAPVVECDKRRYMKLVACLVLYRLNCTNYYPALSQLCSACKRISLPIIILS